MLSCKSSTTAGSTTVASIGEQTAQEIVDGEQVVSSIPFFSSILPSISNVSSTTSLDTRDRYESFGSSIMNSYSKDSSTYTGRIEYDESVRSYLPSISEAKSSFFDTGSIDDKQTEDEQDIDDQQGHEKQIHEDEEEQDHERGNEKRILQEEGQDLEQEGKNEDDDVEEERIQKEPSRSFWGYFFSRSSSAVEKKNGMGVIVEEEDNNDDVDESEEQDKSRIESPSKSREEMGRNKEEGKQDAEPRQEEHLQLHRSSTTEHVTENVEQKVSRYSNGGEVVTTEDFTCTGEEEQRPVLEDESDKVSVHYSIFGESVTYEDFNRAMEEAKLLQDRPSVIEEIDEQSYDCSEWGHTVTLEDFNRVLEEQQQGHSIMEKVSTPVDDNEESRPAGSDGFMKIIIAPASWDGAANQDRYNGPLEEENNTEKRADPDNVILTRINAEQDEEVLDRYSPASEMKSEVRDVEIREINTNLLMNSPSQVVDVFSSRKEEENEVVPPTKNNFNGVEEIKTESHARARDKKILKGRKKDKRQIQQEKNGASKRSSPKKKQVYHEARDPSPQRRSDMRHNRDCPMEHRQKDPMARRRGRVSIHTKKPQEELHFGNEEAHPKQEIPTKSIHKQTPIRDIKDRVSQKHQNHAQKWSATRLDSSSLPRRNSSTLFSKETLAGAAKAFLRGIPRKNNGVIAGKKKGSDRKNQNQDRDTVEGSDRKIKSCRQDTAEASDRKIKSQRRVTVDKKKKRSTMKKSEKSYQQRELEETSQYRVEILSRF